MNQEFDCPRCGHCCPGDVPETNFGNTAQPVETIRAMTDQIATLVWERDELLKQVQRYEQHGVTCQTYRHKINRTCSECNVQENYTSPPQRKPLTDEEIEPIAIDILGYGALHPDDMALFKQIARAIEAAHGIKE
jgi:hypothetical protein